MDDNFNRCIAVFGANNPEWGAIVITAWQEKKRFPATGVLCNIVYQSETHIRLKFPDISFVHNIRVNNPIVLTFGTELGSITAVLCAKLQND